MVQTRHQSKIQHEESDDQLKSGKHKISDTTQLKQNKKRKTKAEKEHEKTKAETIHEKEHEKHDQHKKEEEEEDKDQHKDHHKEDKEQHHPKEEHHKEQEHHHTKEHKEHHRKDSEKTSEESLLHSSTLHKNMNSDITDILREVAFFQKSKGNSGKGFAYDRAANAIETYPTRITSGDEAKQISGIGDKIAAQIDEILTSGKLKMLEEEKRDHNLKLIEELAEAKGVGPIRARALVEKEGIKSLEDLKKESYQLPTTTRLGIKYLDDLDKKISREECEKVAEKIEKYAKQIDSNLSITIVGEYRRGEKEITETSLLLVNNEGNEDNETMNKLKDILENEKVIVETVAHGKQRLIFGIHVSNNAPFHWVEIHLVPKEGYYAALLSMTGPTEFIKEMRSIAKSHDYKLSEYGFFQGRKVHTMKRVPINSEEDIFKTINLEYRPPSQRRFSSLEPKQ